MAEQAQFKLRVVISDQLVKKVVLPEKPCDLQQLYRQLVEQVDGMPEQFVLMYEDAEFDNSLVSLDSIDDLKNFGSLTVIQIDGESSSVPLVKEIQNNSDHLRTVVSWPQPFVIPEFDVNVEMQLQQAPQDGFRVPWALKRDILQKLAVTIHAIKAYPSGRELESVAKELVEKYPCLHEKGTVSGWAGWKNSLMFKMGNFRTTLNKLGCTEVAVNARKRQAQASLGKNVKKPKHNEVNFLPNVLTGEDEVEVLCRSLRENYYRQPMDAAKLVTEMGKTFAIRRQEIVCQKPSVESIVDRWPALFLPSQIVAEFRRITNVDVNVFYGTLDSHLEQLQCIFSNGSGKKANAMKDLMDSIKGNENASLTLRRTCILRCIPLYFGEKPEYLYKDFTADVDDNYGPGQFVAVSGDPLQPDNISVVVEGNTVVDDVADFPTAVCLFFALHYVLNLQYSNGKPSRTFECLQKVFLKIGDSLSPRLLSLNKKLFSRN